MRFMILLTLSAAALLCWLADSPNTRLSAPFRSHVPERTSVGY